jgi:murein DD-endopeptidase MepM/ murein hydrolase activator NlpD
MPIYLASRKDGNRDFAFHFRDAEGAPSSDGFRYHSAVDWFAPANTLIEAPVDGIVVESYSTSDVSGPVFGGVLKLKDETGMVWVLRHVIPLVSYGTKVLSGSTVAKVSPWTGGTPHLHLEIWKNQYGGYVHENMIDPKTVTWVEEYKVEEKPDLSFYYEELPASQGGAGPDVVGTYRFAAYAAGAQLLRRARGETVSRLAGDDGKFYVLRWAPGTYGDKYRWGPFTKEDRDSALKRRESVTSRAMRAFKGRNLSNFPWPKAS